MNQVGSCSLEYPTAPAKPVRPSILTVTVTVIGVVFVASVLLATFLPYLVQFSMGVMS